MPASASAPIHAPVTWAQRKDVLYVTICVEDCKSPVIELDSQKLHFKGRGGPNQSEFECTIEFYNEIDNENTRRSFSDRNIQFIIPKKEAGPFWPRLLKDTKKAQWLKVDFQKWKDEDDEEEFGGGGGADNDFEGMMRNMGGMGGMGGKPDLGSFEDSDDEDLPDLEDDKQPEETPSDEEKDEKGETHAKKNEDDKEVHATAAT